MRKKLIPAVLAVLLVIMTAAYTLFWFWSAQLIRAQIWILYADADTYNIEIQGDFPTISGFPGAHTVNFSGRIIGPDAGLVLPLLTIRGFFLPGQPVEVELPQGIALIGEYIDPDIWSLDRLHALVRIPDPLPKSDYAEDLHVWRHKGGRLEIMSAALQKGALNIDGEGVITLDEQLQPAGQLDLNVSGYIEFIAWMQQRHLIRSRDALIAGAVMAGLSSADANGGRTVTMPLTLRNRQLSAGPLEIATLPALDWPQRDPPPARLR